MIHWQDVILDIRVILPRVSVPELFLGSDPGFFSCGTSLLCYLSVFGENLSGKNLNRFVLIFLRGIN